MYLIDNHLLIKMPRKKSAVAKRRQDCKQCLRPIRGNYAKHEGRCRLKHGDWHGWIYYLMDGIT